MEQAIRKDDAAAIAKLVKEKPELLNARFTGSAFTPLHMARMLFKEKAFQALLDAGANPNERSKAGEPILNTVVGARGLSPFYTEALLKAGADPNAITTPTAGSFKKQPVAFTAMFTALKLMLQHGMTPDPETEDLPLVIHISTYLKENELLELLPEMVAHGLKLEEYGSGIWRNCARKGYKRVLDYLKSQGVTPL